MRVTCARTKFLERQETKSRTQNTGHRTQNKASSLSFCVLSSEFCVLFLIFRYRRVNFIRPSGDAASQIRELAGKTRARQSFNRACAASAHLAMDDRLARRINLRHASQDLSKRDMNGVWNARNRILCGFAHLYNLPVLAPVQFLFQLL